MLKKIFFAGIFGAVASAENGSEIIKTYQT